MVGREAGAPGDDEPRFRIRVCMRRYFADERARCLLLVSGRRRVRWLARRLRALFPLPPRTALLSRGHLLPRDEPLALLDADDLVEVVPRKGPGRAGEGAADHAVDSRAGADHELRRDAPEPDPDSEMADVAPSPAAEWDDVRPTPAAEWDDVQPSPAAESDEVPPSPAAESDELRDRKRRALVQLEHYCAAPPAARARRRRVRRRRRPAPAPAGPPGEGELPPAECGVAPGEGGAAPAECGVAPGGGWAAPGDGGVAPGEGEAAPGDGGVAPGEGEAAPGDGGAAPAAGAVRRDAARGGRARAARLVRALPGPGHALASLDVSPAPDDSDLSVVENVLYVNG